MSRCRILNVPLAAQGFRTPDNPLGYTAIGQQVQLHGLRVLHELVDQLPGKFDVMMLRSPCGVTADDARAPRRRLLSIRQEIVDPMGYPVFSRWSRTAMESYTNFMDHMKLRRIDLGYWIGLATARDDGRRRRWMTRSTIDAHLADAHQLRWAGARLLGADAAKWLVGKGGKPEKLLDEWRAAFERIPAMTFVEGFTAHVVAAAPDSDKKPIEHFVDVAPELNKWDRTMWLLHGTIRELPNPTPPIYALALPDALRMGLIEKTW